MGQLIHLVYASVSTHPFSAQELTRLLEKSRAANEQAGITGMLLYAEGSFFQVLEGEASVVDGVLARIHSDPRHRNLIVIMREPIPRRSFEEWSMGFSSVTSEDLAHIAGLNDFFGQRSCLTRLGTGRAQKLLAAFASGRWRAKISGQAAVVS